VQYLQCYGFQNFKSGMVERFRRRYILGIVAAELQTDIETSFQKKKLIIQIFWISGWLSVPYEFG
jgi:hypothetical protein